ncbi:MAG: response regulator transcription factor [Clostridia bacterium]|nr:response regulator transcription factor [Clostridia bacterium]
MRLLFAEDERDLNRILTKKLTEEGYSVDSCYDGVEAMDYLTAIHYDGVILDVMMPKADGFAVLENMRKQGIDTPVLFLTARDAVSDRVHGLDLGASDYLVKPFSMEELMARVRALTRRSYDTLSSTLTAADLTMELRSHTVTRAGKTIELSAKEYALLSYLLHNKNLVLTREQIEDHIWNADYEGGTNVVDVYIRYLRKKVDDGFEPKLIHTVRGVGYVLREESEGDAP